MRSLTIALLVLLCLAPVSAQTSDSQRARKLQNDIRWLVNQQHSRMRAGVGLIHLPSGERIEVDASDAYPLASVFKVPIMLELARQIQSGETGLALATELTIQESDKCIGSGRLQNRKAGSTVSLERALELMETISDNTATDMIFERIGLESVDRFMHGLGLKSSQIFLTNRQAWLISLGQGGQFRGKAPGQIAAAWAALSIPQRKKAAAQVAAENRSLTLKEFQRLEDASAQRNSHQEDVLVATTVDNLASPRDLADLLARLRQGKLLDSRWTAYTLGILARQRYNTRIPRMLPNNLTIYHKTGTIAGVVNDIGIVEIAPGNELVVVVLIRDVDSGASAQAETLIAKIALLAYERYR